MVQELEAGDLQVPSNPNYPKILWNILSSAIDSSVWKELQEKQIWTVPLEGREAGSCHCWASVRPWCLCLTASSAPSLKQHQYCTVQLVQFKQFYSQRLWCQGKEKKCLWTACFKWMWLHGGLGVPQIWLWLKTIMAVIHIIICGFCVMLPHANGLFPRFRHFFKWNISPTAFKVIWHIYLDNTKILFSVRLY